jgi:hypothetical protein
VQKVFLGRPLPSAQIKPLPPSTDNLGTTFKRLGKNPVMDSAVQVELQRQTKVIRRGSQINPKIHRKQERDPRWGAVFAGTEMRRRESL